MNLAILYGGYGNVTALEFLKIHKCSHILRQLLLRLTVNAKIKIQEKFRKISKHECYVCKTQFLETF